MQHIDNINKISDESEEKRKKNENEIYAVSFSSLPLVDFSDLNNDKKRAAFFSISEKTTAKGTIIEKVDENENAYKNANENKIEIYGCDELKNELEIIVRKIFEKFEFPYGANIQISFNKYDKFSVFSATAIAAYGIVASKYGVIYNEAMERNLRKDKSSKRKIIKIRGKILTYDEIFDEILNFVDFINFTDVNYIQAYASYYGGIVMGVANKTNKEKKILRYAESEELLVVIIPKEEESEKSVKTKKIKGADYIIWDEILKGNFYTAANLSCALQYIESAGKFNEILDYLMEKALYCGITEDYIFGAFRNKNFDPSDLKKLNFFDENLIITLTNNSPAGIYYR